VNETDVWNKLARRIVGLSCLCISLVWLGSLFRCVAFSSTHFSIYLNPGHVVFVWRFTPINNSPRPNLFFYVQKASFVKALGASVSSPFCGGSDQKVAQIGFPLWAPCLLLILFWLWLRWARQKGTNAPRCSHCSYNLTCNTTGICPECGSPIPEAHKQMVRPINRPN